MSDAPERIWLDDDGNCWMGGNTRALQKYIRADAAAAQVEADLLEGWNAAIEAARDASPGFPMTGMYRDLAEIEKAVANAIATYQNAITALRKETP